MRHLNIAHNIIFGVHNNPKANNPTQWWSTTALVGDTTLPRNPTQWWSTTALVGDTTLPRCPFARYHDDWVCIRKPATL